LVAIAAGTHRSEFTYDGNQHRVRILEKDNGITQSDVKLIWCSNEICEGRGGDGTTVVERAFAVGEQISGSTRFFIKDHLGSVAGVTDSSQSVIAAFAFDPVGRRTQTQGTEEAKVGFTGHRYQETNLWLAWYRAYDSDLGRWISEDPIGYADGANLFAYVRNEPIRYVDNTGLYTYKPGVPPVSAPLANLLTCMETCLGQSFVVTATTNDHPPKTPHGRGEAADIRWRPGISKKLMCCAARCKAGYGQDEAANPSSKSTGPHFPVQIPAGRNGGKGDLPCESCEP
jgi:RHS repeat-associated protein